jgi:hypothetical protein
MKSGEKLRNWCRAHIQGFRNSLRRGAGVPPANSSAYAFVFHRKGTADYELKTRDAKLETYWRAGLSALALAKAEGPHSRSGASEPSRQDDAGWLLPGIV